MVLTLIILKQQALPKAPSISLAFTETAKL